MKNLSKNDLSKLYAKLSDDLDDRRLNVERLRASFCPMSFPGHDAEGDGKIDPIRSTGFLQVDQIPDTQPSCEIEEEEESDGVIRDANYQFNLPHEPKRPCAPPSRMNYARIFYNNLPPIKNVSVVVKGRGLVPYATVRDQLRTR